MLVDTIDQYENKDMSLVEMNSKNSSYEIVAKLKKRVVEVCVFSFFSI